MEQWVIGYYVDDKGTSSVERWIMRLTYEQAESVAHELEVLKLLGNRLRLPHSRSLGKGLFELRERHYGYRIYYCFVEGRAIILLVAGDKDTQRRDIASARVKMRKLMTHAERLWK